MKFLIILLLIFLFGVYPVINLILSKSSISMCENKGFHGQGDPKNLVDGKSCKKKMLVTLTVKNNQKGTEKLHATVSRVRDETSNDYARLYNPFMITVSKSPVYIIYPYTYTGYIVNNYPYEEIRMMRGNWWASDSSKQCYDQWQAKERAELHPTCGYQYKYTDVKQADGQYRKVKSRIWDSQGFCCHCSGEEKSATLMDEARNFKRSGLTCKLFTSNTQASGHCMKMDPLWYNVFSFEESYRDFTIHVKAFDQVEKVVNNRTQIDYVNGGEIVLSPSRKSGVGKYQRIIAHYVGDFAPVKSYPVLTSNYFLIPKLDGKVDAYTHPQLKEGFSKYLILPMSLVDLRAGKCNMVGVSYSSFKNQASSGKGYGCQQKKGYCLNNQPFHYFKEDEERVGQGKQPRWFPGRYGKLAGVKKQKDNSSSFVLAYELEEEHTSLVALQISADDLILVYNRASGEIVRAAIKDFESVSNDGKLQVEIINTGYVTANFHISIDACSEGIDMIPERTVSIDPQVTEKLTFKLRQSEQSDSENNCVIRLFDAKRVEIGTKNVNFSTKAPCVCEVSGCRCECSEDGSVRCIEMEGKWNISTKIWTVKKTAGLLGRIGDFFKDIWGKLLGLFDIFGFLKYLVPVIACLIIGCCCLKCGCFPAIVSCCCKCFSFGKGGGIGGMGGADQMTSLFASSLLGKLGGNQQNDELGDDKKKKPKKSRRDDSDESFSEDEESEDDSRKRRSRRNKTQPESDAFISENDSDDLEEIVDDRTVEQENKEDGEEVLFNKNEEHRRRKRRTRHR